MASQLTGYALLTVLGLILYLIAMLAIDKSKRNRIQSYLLADRRIQSGMIASSVLACWTWTTTIMGAAEAGMWYGISGGLSYSLGAAIPFLVFIPLVRRLKKIMPEGITYTEFIGERFGPRTKNAYFVFATLVVLYVFMEQLIGIGLVFKNTFGVSFKLTVLIVAFIVISYIIRGGICGTFLGNVFHFLTICLLLCTICFILTRNLGLHFIYDGLLDASENKLNPNYNQSILMLNSIYGMRYGLVALVVALGQVLLDQGYYSIAMSAKSTRDLTAGFLMGAVIFWIPISILSASIFGHSAIALRLTPVQGIDTTTEIATTILKLYGSPFLSILFAVLIFSIGVSTGGNCLIGILSIFTVDFYSSKFRPDATDPQKIRFGTVITVCIAALCSFIAIALEGISLLKIDMFSGIFFAAPCGTLIAGVYSKFSNENITLLATFLGLITGFSTWIYFNMSGGSWFYGCLLSFAVPFIIIAAAYPFTRQRFNFVKLKYYKADGSRNDG